MRHRGWVLRVFIEPTARPFRSLLPIVRNLNCILLGFRLLLTEVYRKNRILRIMRSVRNNTTYITLISQIN